MTPSSAALKCRSTYSISASTGGSRNKKPAERQPHGGGSFEAWVEIERGIPAGNWQPGRRDEDYEPLRHSLSSVVPWSADNDVLFAKSWAVVLQCTWETFLEHWQGFLYLESDAPMLLLPRHRRQCILFLHDGRSFFIDAARGSS